jgi:hypothetical protein
MIWRGYRPRDGRCSYCCFSKVRFDCGANFTRSRFIPYDPDANRQFGT